MLPAALLHLFDCYWDVASEVGRLPRGNLRDCHVHALSIAYPLKNCQSLETASGNRVTIRFLAPFRRTSSYCALDR